MIGKPLRLNGSSRGRRTLIVVLLSTKLELSQKVFDKFKVLTTMRVSHSYLCLSLSESCKQLPHFMKSGKWINKTTILNGFIKEELYMMQPTGFVNPKDANKMCKLQRSICGLVQASQSWNTRFDKLIKAYSLYRLAVKPVFTSEWEHYNISDKYM